jgi:hypothetical protein
MSDQAATIVVLWPCGSHGSTSDSSTGVRAGTHESLDLGGQVIRVDTSNCANVPELALLIRAVATPG